MISMTMHDLFFFARFQPFLKKSIRDEAEISHEALLR